MPRSNDNPESTARPAVDEWGMYDPQQAGLAALFAKLEARSRQPLPEPDAAQMAASMEAANKLKGS